MARSRALAWWFAGLLLLLPVTTAWNVVVGSLYPKLTIKVGSALYGVTPRVVPELSVAAIRDGRFQRAAATLVGESIPIRPYLIRLNNQIAYTLFGELNVPGMMIGEGGQLIETGYIQEYCNRHEDQAKELADRAIPVLQNIQNYYKSRGGIFLYVITPSKMAHLPEYFLRIGCASTAAARTGLVPEYAERLRNAGIAVFDAATFTHALKGSYSFELFPRGGIHWNSIGVARAVQEIIKAVNQQSGGVTLPLFDFDVSASDKPRGADRDLADLMNLILPPLNYPTPKLNYKPAAACGPDLAQIDAAVVGGSFMYDPTELLSRRGCLSGLNLYFYLRMGRFTGVPQRQAKAGLSPQDLRPLRDVRLLVLEENETLIGRSGYVDALNSLLSAD